MDEAMTQALAEAAEAYVAAPKRLQDLILKAADAGSTPAEIVRAINHALTYDYVARLVRKARADGLIKPAPAKS